MKNASQFVNYQNPLIIYYYNYFLAKPIKIDFLQPEKNIYYNEYQWMIDKPDDQNNSNRQHIVYATMNKRSTNVRLFPELKQMNMEEFKQYGSIRVSTSTELCVLTQAILARTITAATIK